jgi:hypothetical protein
MDFSKLDGVFKHEAILRLPACKVCSTFSFPGIEKSNYLDDKLNPAGCNAMSIDGNCNVVLLLCVSPGLEQD